MANKFPSLEGQGWIKEMVDVLICKKIGCIGQLFVPIGCGIFFILIPALIND